MLIAAWILEVLIVAAGIHLFLRFVRTTRGIRLIRGLFVSVIVGVVGLWGLSTYLDLQELEHILQGATGLIVVTFAIIFQPELRRAIAQLGESSLAGRLSRSGADTVATIVRAAQSMAAARIGAIIAFEREVSLSPYLEAGTELDCSVKARLIETIFHPGSPLHDGAVVVRRDRVTHAGCFLPLPQESPIDARLGTRHRAALGLTEDTDAVVLVVSEETGTISLAREGKMRLHVAPDQVEEELRQFIDTRSAQTKAGARTWKRDLIWMPASILLACGILYVAHQDIKTTETYNVTIAGVLPGNDLRPEGQRLLVSLPGEGYRLVRPEPNEDFPIQVSGSRAQLEELGNSLAGVLEIADPSWTGGPLALDEVRWRNPVLGLDYRWKDDAPNLEVDLFDSRRIQLTLDDVEIDDSQLNPRYELAAGARFDPAPRITLYGPSSEIGEASVAFEPIVLTETDLDERSEHLTLTPELVQRGFSLQGPPVSLVLPIGPARRDAGTVAMEIATVCMDPERTDELERWQLPAHALTARFTIQTSGLIPVNADPGSPAQLERFNRIRDFVEANLLVFVDLAELPPQREGRSVPVRWTWRERSPEALGLDLGELSGYEELDVRLDSDAEILLESRTPRPTSGGTQSGSRR